MRVFLQNLSRKFGFHYNLTGITVILLESEYTFMITSRTVLRRMRNVSDKIVEKIITNFYF